MGLVNPDSDEYILSRLKPYIDMGLIFVREHTKNKLEVYFEIQSMFPTVKESQDIKGYLRRNRFETPYLGTYNRHRLNDGSVCTSNESFAERIRNRLNK